MQCDGRRWLLPREEPWEKSGEYCETYQSQGIGNLADENLERLDASLLAKLVAAVAVEAGLGLFRRKTDLVVDAQLALDILVAEGVGGRRHGLVGLPGDVSLQGLLLLLFLAHCLGFSAVAWEIGG